MITKMVLGIGIVLSSLVLFLGAAPAGAEPNSSPDPNPFGSLTCNCQPTAPAGDPGETADVNQGILAGVSH
jgi:hypothetical protein